MHLMFALKLLLYYTSFSAQIITQGPGEFESPTSNIWHVHFTHIQHCNSHSTISQLDTFSTLTTSRLSSDFENDFLL